MAPKKQVEGKKRKTDASSSRAPSRFNADHFLGAPQSERYKALGKRTVWHEKAFDISDQGTFAKFVQIIDSRRWGRLITPPETINEDLVREFYANAIPVEDDEEVSFKTMVRGREIRFDRDAINAYLGNPSRLASDQLCAYSQLVARGNWDVQAIERTVLRPGYHIKYNAARTQPLRAMRDHMQIFSQLLLLLVLHNILPRSHTSDATMRTLGLIYFMERGLQIDVARVISQEMKYTVLSGIRPTPVKYNCNLGFPGLIMGLIKATLMTIPSQVHHYTSTIDDNHAARFCKWKNGNEGEQHQGESSAPPPTTSTIDPNFQTFFNYLCDQNDAGFRAMTAVHQSIYQFQQQQPVMTPPEFQTYVQWPAVRPNFSGEGSTVNVEGDQGVDAEDDEDFDNAAADAYGDDEEDEDEEMNDDDDDDDDEGDDAESD